MCLLILSAIEPHLAQTVQALCKLPQSLYLICASVLLCLEGLVSLVFSIPSGSNTVSVFSPIGSLKLKGRDLMETSLRSECSEISHSLLVVWP